MTAIIELKKWIDGEIGIWRGNDGEYCRYLDALKDKLKELCKKDLKETGGFIQTKYLKDLEEVTKPLDSEKDTSNSSILEILEKRKIGSHPKNPKEVTKGDE